MGQKQERAQGLSVTRPRVPEPSTRLGTAEGGSPGPAPGGLLPGSSPLVHLPGGAHLHGDHQDLDHLQHELARLAALGPELVTGAHEKVLEPAAEVFLFWGSRRGRRSPRLGPIPEAGGQEPLRLYGNGRGSEDQAWAAPIACFPYRPLPILSPALQPKKQLERPEKERKLAAFYGSMQQRFLEVLSGGLS